MVDPEFQEIERAREREVEVMGPPAEVHCPNCGRDDVYGQGDGHYLCNDCGLEWDHS